MENVTEIFNFLNEFGIFICQPCWSKVKNKFFQTKTLNFQYCWIKAISVLGQMSKTMSPMSACFLMNALWNRSCVCVAYWSSQNLCPQSSETNSSSDIIYLANNKYLAKTLRQFPQKKSPHLFPREID